MGDILKIKKLGTLKKYNGNDYEMDLATNEIKMSQRKLIESMVNEVNVKPTKIPGFPNQIQHPNEEENPIEGDRYRRLVGKLLYICNKSRPDIMSQCRELSQYMSNPSQKHWALLIKTIFYFYHTIDDGLILRSREENEVELTEYVDSDYAGNKEDRKIITGYVILLNGSTIS